MYHLRSQPVFVQTTAAKRKGGKTFVSYLVRESFRTPEGPRSRTVCNITELPPPTRDLIAASLKGQSFVATQALQLHEALDYGGLAVLNHTWQRFERDRLLAAMGSSHQRKLLQAMSQAHLKYVTRLSSATLQSLLQELPQDVQLPLGDRQHVVEIAHQGQRDVIAGGRWRQQRDEERRVARLEKAEKELKRLAAVRRKKVNAHKLASQVGRALQRLKAHK
jgi:hypothetical protein